MFYQVPNFIRSFQKKTHWVHNSLGYLSHSCIDNVTNFPVFKLLAHKLSTKVMKPREITSKGFVLLLRLMQNWHFCGFFSKIFNFLGFFLKQAKQVKNNLWDTSQIN